VPLGEEYTVALGVAAVLARRVGPVVTNLSTSRIVDAVCEAFRAPLYRAPVGEAHVVGAMHAHRAIAGGEGNGGMILPAAHFGRDGLVAVALIANTLATRGVTLRALAAELPPYAMVKEKVSRGDGSWADAARRLRERFAGWDLDDRDGLRFSRGDEWLHVRASGTEPVVRFIAETRVPERTRELIEEGRAALAATVRGN